MTEENDVWTEDLESYVAAYAEEERAGVDAAAALTRFNEAQVGAAISLDERRGRRRGVAFALVGAALAAGLAGVWVSNGRSLQLEDGEPATLTQDAADTSGETRAAVPLRPNPPRAGHTAPSTRDEAPPEPEPELEPAPLEEIAKAETVVAAPGRRVRRPAAKAPEPDAPPQPTALARELSTLRSLREAARSHEYASALKLVREHRVQFPKPTLAAERDLIEIEALCGLGRESQTAKAKAAFAKAHPTHHLLRKAKKVCEEKSKGAQNGAPLRHETE